MPRIAHVSDSHGWFPPLPDPDTFDFVVHSGDFCANRSRIRIIEEAFQPMWLADNAERLKQWIGDKPILMTSGNHDFVLVAPYLHAMGIEAYRLDDVLVSFAGLNFYGFPHVPYFTGEWNYECGTRDLAARTEAIDLEGVDVLVTHSPMYGVLDRNGYGERCGSKPMRKLLQDSEHVPRWLLHGHLHESAGVQGWSRGIMVSNAATTQRIIEL